MPTQTLENEVWKLSVAPGVGASVAGLWVKVGGAWEPLLRETPPEAVGKGSASPFSSFTLAPFSNRIKDATFTFRGESYKLRAEKDGNTKHGDVRSRPWELLHADELSVECGLKTQDFENFNFPFPFVITVSYRLEDERLETRLRLTNTGERDMPAGLGLHPYFQRQLAGSEEVALQFTAAAHYVLDNDKLPTGELIRPSGKVDFRKGKVVGDTELDDLYQGWSEPVILHYPGVGNVELSADPVFSHLVVFTAQDGSLAVEPVTHATDGFNLRSRGFGGSGVRVLAPGEVLGGSVWLKFKEERRGKKQQDTR